jgi:5-methylcytosine-specific restriction endonuclease McrA
MSAGSSRGAAWNNLRDQVLKRDGGVCNYCGNEATEADHVIPKAKGGQDILSNLVAACKRCNGSKSDRTEVRANWFNKQWLDHL